MKRRTLALVSNGKKYRGKYVALESFSSRKVIGSGNKPLAVLKKARKKGIVEPVIFYVPDGKLIY